MASATASGDVLAKAAGASGASSVKSPSGAPKSSPRVLGIGASSSGSATPGGHGGHGPSGSGQGHPRTRGR